MKYRTSNSIATILRLLGFVACLNFSGCALLNVLDGDDDSDSQDTVETETAEKLYKEAHASLFSKQDFTTAIEKFELLEARYPFGKYAQQA
ncbi:MAG: tetratricopeptide repeat protein, partial [Gammaproteobacteria bacterium]|nr:tetratricopeptide repeat protein [Gammaproteobacteria bacterium]